MGGTQTGSGSTKVPVAESFDLSNPTGLTLNVTMPPTFARATGSNWYPFVRRLPKGKLLLVPLLGLAYMMHCGTLHRLWTELAPLPWQMPISAPKLAAASWLV